MFSASKVASVQLLSASHASLLSWSVDPRLSRPDVMNNTRVAQLTNDINTVLTRLVDQPLAQAQILRLHASKFDYSQFSTQKELKRFGESIEINFELETNILFFIAKLAEHGNQ